VLFFLTFFMLESKLVTYVAGSAKSTVDYIMVRQGDKLKVRNVKVVPNEECIPKHKLLVMDMWFNTTKRRHKEFKSKVRAWKLEGQTCEEYTRSTRRPASANRTAHRQFQATGQPVSGTQASDTMTSWLPCYEAECV